MLKPLPRVKWNFTTAAHLVNRAGCWGPPQDIERLTKFSPEEAVSHFVDYEQIPDSTPDPDWARPEPDRAEKLMELRTLGEEERRGKQREIQRADREHMLELRGWWLRRRANGPRPFHEKKVLFWPSDLVTSVAKAR